MSVRLAVLVGVLGGCAPCAAAQAALPMGTHRMVLDCPGGELPFHLQLTGDGAGGLLAFVINGSERIAVPEVVAGEQLALRFPHYDSELVLDWRRGKGALAGEWIKRRGNGEPTRMKVHASPAPARFAIGADAIGTAPADWCLGRFRVAFAKSDDPAVGEFRRAQGPYHDLEGTFLTTLGDYRYLAGNQRVRGFSLSCFDGAHAFLFHAEHVQGDDSIRGEFWSSDTWHETWTAVRDEHAALPDGFGLTKWRDGAKPGDAVFHDLDGRTHTLDDDGFAGTVRVVELFGTWCPNCHDHGAYMVELQRRYAERGLKIVGIAFEHDADAGRSARQVRAFAARHGATYPIWIGGLSDKQLAGAALGWLDRVRAFPTTLFVDRAGVVRGIYQGFSGPATGAEHARLRERFETLIETMLRDG